MPLLHDISLRDVMALMVLVMHSILLLKLLCKRLVMRDRALPIQEQTAIRIQELIFINRAGPFTRLYGLLSSPR